MARCRGVHASHRPEIKGGRFLTMPLMTLNLALFLIGGLSPCQFFFVHRENPLHCFFEFVGRLLLDRCWHCDSIFAFSSIFATEEAQASQSLAASNLPQDYLEVPKFDLSRSQF